MKLFKANRVNIDHVKYCQECFSFEMPSDLWRKRVTKFDSKFPDFYVKVQLSFFSFFVCSFCCILCLLCFVLLLPCFGEIKIHRYYTDGQPLWQVSAVADGPARRDARLADRAVARGGRSARYASRRPSQALSTQLTNDDPVYHAECCAPLLREVDNTLRLSTCFVVIFFKFRAWEVPDESIPLFWRY